MGFRVIFVDYLKNCTLHGAKYIADESSHWTERTFWVICVILSWIGSVMLILSSLSAFRNNPISFVVETSYKEWDTHFPAVVVCETKNMDGVLRVADEVWGPQHDFTLEEILTELSFFRGEAYHTVTQCAGEESHPQCIHGNFSYYTTMVRSLCENTMENCYWNDNSFNCCEYFLPMDTELGICYGINSQQVRDRFGVKLSMISNRTTGPGKITFEIKTEANIYVIGEEEVPSLTSSKSDYLPVLPYVNYKRTISVLNIENDSGVREVPVENRRCRFHDETGDLQVHRMYSYSACSVQCRRDAQMRMCGCTSHLMPNTNTDMHCNMTGMVCLNQKSEQLSVVVANWSRKRGLVCDCLPSCSELDILVRRDEIYPLDTDVSLVEISLQALPTERYRRNVIRGKLDLVVSMGGTTSLFVGASLLSFVEWIYYFTVRIYGTYYMTTNSQ